MAAQDSPMAKVISGYDALTRWLNYLQPAFLLFIRVYIGYQSLISGWAHLNHINQTAEFFTSLHIPFPKFNVILSASTEVVGGLFLLLGFCSRLTALVLTGNFFVALFSVELSNFDFSWHELAGKVWNDQSPILNDTAFPFLVTAIIVLLFGPGLLSIDGLLRWAFGKKPTQPQGFQVVV
jgi:putative oxidoreductase